MKRWAVVLAAGAVSLSMAASLCAQGAQESVRMWISDWRSQTFLDSAMPGRSPDSVDLTVARNDIEPFQINVRAETEGQIQYVAFSDLVSGGNVISSDHLSYSYVDYIRPVSNSRYSDKDDPESVRDSDGTYWVNVSNPVRRVNDKTVTAFPEILSETQSKKLKPYRMQPIWVKIHVPADAQPGMYLGVLKVQTTLGAEEFNINLDVKSAVIPDSTSESAFDLEIWSQLVGNFDTDVDVIESAYGVKVDSPEWWQIMGSFADLMKENRLNVMTVNQTELLLHGPGTSVSDDGTVTFDWSFFNRFVQFFKERGGIKEFVGGPLAKYKANPRNYNNDKPGEEINDYSASYVECIVRDPATGRPVKRLLPVDLEAYQEGKDVPALDYLNQYAAALHENLTAQGLYGMFSHHIIDEPGKRQQAALYPVLRNVLSDKCPGMKAEDAFTVWTAQEQAASAQRFAVIENSLDELPDMMEQCLKPGDELWVYTSSVPIEDNYLNRAIDQPVWNMEMLGWFAFKHHATGYLHWGLNQWNTWTRDYLPFPDYPQEKMWDNVLGDGSCVYPDKENLGIRSSIRVEALRETSELSSLLWQASAKHPEEVQELLNKMLRSGKDYETDIDSIHNARERVIELASE